MPEKLQDLFVFKAESINPETWEAEDSDRPMSISASEGGTQVLTKQTKLMPYMRFFWERIKEQIFYHDAILFRQIQGVVKVKIHVDRNGKLLYFNEAAMTGPEILKGWVAKGIAEALHKPILETPMERPLEILLDFDFKVFPYPPELASYNFAGNQLHFDVHAYKPGAGVSKNREGMPAITLPMYAQPQTRSMDILEVDYFARLKMYADACEFRNAEGGCWEAAKIYDKLNKLADARKYYQKACGLGLKEAC